MAHGSYVCRMTVQALDTITLWDGAPGVILTPLGFGDGVVQANDHPDRVRLVLEDSTALGRGYIAHWEVRGRELWLRAVHGRMRLTAGHAVLAEWVSAEVRVGVGPPPDELNDSYAGNYARQVRLVIDEGLIESAWSMERLL